MKCLFALLQLFLIFQIVLNMSSLSSATKNMLKSKQQLSDTLLQGAQLLSSNLQYSLRMQTDGNLVLYSTGSTNGRGQDFALWASGTNGQSTGPYKAVM